MIRIENVSLAYGRSKVLHDVSLTIPGGGITALIGPNGAGKSSLLGLVARLQPLSAGTITIDGLDVGATDGRTLARKLAVLRQDNHVASRLTVRELVGFGRFPHSRGHVTDDDRRIIDEAMALFGLQDLSTRFIETLSGGQRQRAFVAMAYCQYTDYLLLDEPLNNLDMYFARDLMQSLRQIADRHGRTIVIVLHDINYAGRFADRIVAMKNGRIVADGPPGEIIAQDTLREIYGFDIPVVTIDRRPVALPFA